MNQRVAELDRQIASLKEQMDVLVNYLKDHQSHLIAHERRFELDESRIDLLDKVLSPITKSARFLRRRWGMLFRPP